MANITFEFEDPDYPNSEYYIESECFNAEGISVSKKQIAIKDGVSSVTIVKSDIEHVTITIPESIVICNGNKSCYKLSKKCKGEGNSSIKQYPESEVCIINYFCSEDRNFKFSEDNENRGYVIDKVVYTITFRSKNKQMLLSYSIKSKIYDITLEQLDPKILLDGVLNQQNGLYEYSYSIIDDSNIRYTLSNDWDANFNITNIEDDEQCNKGYKFVSCSENVADSIIGTGMWHFFVYDNLTTIDFIYGVENDFDFNVKNKINNFLTNTHKKVLISKKEYIKIKILGCCGDFFGEMKLLLLDPNNPNYQTSQVFQYRVLDINFNPITNRQYVLNQEYIIEIICTTCNYNFNYPLNLILNFEIADSDKSKYIYAPDFACSPDTHNPKNQKVGEVSIVPAEQVTPPCSPYLNIIDTSLTNPFNGYLQFGSENDINICACEPTVGSGTTLYYDSRRIPGASVMKKLKFYYKLECCEVDFAKDKITLKILHPNFFFKQNNVNVKSLSNNISSFPSPVGGLDIYYDGKYVSCAKQSKINGCSVKTDPNFPRPPLQPGQDLADIHLPENSVSEIIDLDIEITYQSAKCGNVVKVMTKKVNVYNNCYKTNNKCNDDDGFEIYLVDGNDKEVRNPVVGNSNLTGHFLRFRSRMGYSYEEKYGTTDIDNLVVMIFDARAVSGILSDRLIINENYKSQANCLVSDKFIDPNFRQCGGGVFPPAIIPGNTYRHWIDFKTFKNLPYNVGKELMCMKIPIEIYPSGGVCSYPAPAYASILFGSYQIPNIGNNVSTGIHQTTSCIFYA